MIWSHELPKAPGYYWRRMKEHDPGSEQEPHMIRLTQGEEGLDLWAFNGEWELWGGYGLDRLSRNFEWAGPIDEPDEP